MVILGLMKNIKIALLLLSLFLTGCNALKYLVPSTTGTRIDPKTQATVTGDIKNTAKLGHDYEAENQIIHVNDWSDWKNLLQSYIALIIIVALFLLFFARVLYRMRSPNDRNLIRELEIKQNTLIENQNNLLKFMKKNEVDDASS